MKRNSNFDRNQQTMKNILFLTLFFALSIPSFSQVQYKVITTIESVVPGGLGRSRIINESEEVDYTEYTTERIDGKKSDQGDVKRKDIKIDNFDETKILNFYSMTGINFQNIASNDAVISSVLNDMTSKGWELAFVTSGVESDAGKDDGTGIFITRYVFKRE